MISTTDSATMWADFHTNRTATLDQLPLPLDPASIIHYEGGSDPSDPATTSSPTSTTSTSFPTSTTSGSSSSTSSTRATQAPDSLAANLSGAVSTDGSPLAGNDSWGNKYGNVVLGLLAANLAVGVALLAVVVTMCVRRKERSGPGSRYTPVRFKDPEPLED